ncbi:MAG: DNA methyltransferase [Anaerolineaceae bacterium]|nr:DNA methyltransferase [Anaerolineaceae bacterium]
MNQPNWADQTIWTGDNLSIMRGMNSDSVDLICTDPPFNSNANYAAPIGSEAAGAEFKDTWTLSDIDVEWINLIENQNPQLFRVLLAAMTDSDKSYLAYMAVRLIEMRRILKPTGSIYLHCVSTMSHYLKLVMDAVFGHSNFRNEIIWERDPAGKGAKRTSQQWPRNYDSILLYSKGDQYTFRQQYAPLSESQKKVYRYRDERGEYKAVQRGDYSDKSMEKFLAANKVHTSKTGKEYIKYYLKDAQAALGSVWTDVYGFGTKTASKERTGYPTQKPLDLYKRIVEASSEEGDIVFDPFCGCATTCIAAQNLGRQWCGIDISGKAIELTKLRLQNELKLFSNPIHRTDIPQRTDLGDIPPYNSSENRRFLYGEQGGHCGGCQTHFESRHLEVDHIIARANGGTDHISNLQLLCGSCNRIKGDRGMEYLRVKLQLAS